MIKNICSVCGKEFKSISKFKKYCSLDCKEKQKSLVKASLLKPKICLRCKDKQTLTPLHIYCESCNHIVLIEQYNRHKERSRNNSNKRYQIIKDDLEFKRKRNEKYKIYHVNRYKEDSQFAVAVRLRNLLYQALKTYTKNGKTFSSKKYGIDYNKLIEQLKPFPKNIETLNIDHIKPLCSFNLENIEEIKKAFAPENLRWISEKENKQKIKYDKQLSIKNNKIN